MHSSVSCVKNVSRMFCTGYIADSLADLLMVKQGNKGRQGPWALAQGPWSALGLQRLQRETLGPLGYRAAGPGVLGHRQRATTTEPMGQRY